MGRRPKPSTGGDIARADALCTQVQSHFHTTPIALGFPLNEREDQGCDGGEFIARLGVRK
jgi:hypothetical protein